MAIKAGDHVYGLCLAVLGDPVKAEACALDALRRGGGRSRTWALAHARHYSLAVDERDTAAFDLHEDVAGVEVTELARRLSFTRPPVERAIVELQGRHDLDRAQLGRVLGMAPAAAASLAAEVVETWAAELDPALLAFLGPSDCGELARVLIGTGLFEAAAFEAADVEAAEVEEEADHLVGATLGRMGSSAVSALSTGPVPVVSAGSVTIARLLDAVGPVRNHADGCQTCADRRLAMVSVRDLLARAPFESAPVAVQAAAGATALVPRIWRPAPPPPLEPRSRSWRRRAGLAGAAALSLAVAGGGVALGLHVSDGGGQDRVGALTKLPAVNALGVDAADSVDVGEIFTLVNRSTHAVNWTGATPFPWLALVPDHGRLGPGERADVHTSLLPGAPNATRSATVAISGDDGSATAVGVRLGGGQSPQIDAAISGCTVHASVTAAQSIATASLSWRPHGSASTQVTTVAMAAEAAGYSASLVPPDQPVDWWVTATDRAGSSARSPTHLFALGACPPAAA